MNSVRWTVLLGCGLLAGATACSDDSGGTNENHDADGGAHDAGPSADAGPRTDATVPPIDPEWPVGIPRPDFGDAGKLGEN